MKSEWMHSTANHQLTQILQMKSQRQDTLHLDGINGAKTPKINDLQITKMNKKRTTNN